jgi:hypothetical protein
MSFLRQNVGALTPGYKLQLPGHGVPATAARIHSLESSR